MDREEHRLLSPTDGVNLSNVWHSYGSTTVLHGINLSLDRGSIYGLLGPSGCGKTTLLKVMLGRLEVDEGMISVLGQVPNATGHPVPGHWVGYAPQEAALYPDLTIAETLQFHASMHQLSSADFNARKHQLLTMLDLPDSSKMIRNLSGGQQRRVSLACALLHSPQLVILDEPTVGLDPLLRHRIWEHLRNLASSGTTIIVTTHYIDEARSADRIGLMRHGRILVEGSPDGLLNEYGTDSLEDVFLQVCRDFSRKKHNLPPAEHRSRPVNSAESVRSKPPADEFGASEFGILLEPPESLLHPQSLFAKRFFQIGAISRRKFTQIVRNWKLLAWELLVPTVQICLFMLAIGGDPKSLPLVAVNRDVGYAVPGFNMTFNFGSTYISTLATNQSSSLNLMTNYTLNEGLDLVRRGRAWGVLLIPEYLTATMVSVLENPSSIDFSNDTFVNNTQLHMHMDLTNYQVSMTILQQLGAAFEDLCKQYLGRSLTPIQFSSPVYGSLDSNWTNFLAPGVITVISFAQSIGITAMSFVKERTNGCMDRIYAAGVPGSVIIMGHFVTHSSILVLQVGIMLLVAVYAFQIQVVGNLAYVFTLLLVLGVVGQCFGMFVSSVVGEESEAIQMTLAIFFPALLLSGVIWPIEAIPNWFSWVSLGLPTTWVSSAMRSVMLRGWDITAQPVWLGYVVSAAWALFFLSFAAFKMSAVELSCKRCCKCFRKSHRLDH